MVAEDERQPAVVGVTTVHRAGVRPRAGVGAGH